MKKIDFKKLWPYLAAIVVFMVISIGYFGSDIIDGKVLFQGDTRQGLANGHEIGEYFAKSGEVTRWTGTVFSGMPTYQMSPNFGSANLFRNVTQLLMLYLPSPASLIFLMLIGFFILLKSLRVRTDLSVLGAIAWTFSSYFFIIIEAGHIWKFATLAYVPPVIGGVILAYRGRYWLGGVISALFVALQVLSNHVQMSYYFMFVIAALVISFFVEAIRQKELPRFFKATVTLLIAAVIGVCINLSNLYHTYEYSKQTIRGKAELTHSVPKAAQAQAQNPANPADQNATTANQTASGLERDYIVQWSYGKGETWSLLIPNVKGGATGALGQNEIAKDKLNSQYAEMLSQQNQYWGDQPFTSGPVYVGAFVLALFIFGLFVVEGTLAWPLFVVTALSIFLSWGKNMMWFTNIFLDYMPMYNKFRAVSSILVIAEFTIPLMAVLALKKIIEKPSILLENKKATYTSLGLTAGISLIFALMPTVFFDFLSQQEVESILPQVNMNPQLAPVVENLKSVREAIFTADAWRSLIVVLVGAVIMFLFAKDKIKSGLMVGLIALLCLIDMGGVNKRYLNSDKFMYPREISNPFPKTAADEQILQDKDPNFRVFNMTVDPFNDATTSYYHKSVGGYHAAKLRRYQDIIDFHLTPEFMRMQHYKTFQDFADKKDSIPVLNMLNTKYFILGTQQGQMAVPNPGALGNAWFVSELKWVNNADEEIDALNNFNPAKTAVVDKRFENVLPKNTAAHDSTSTVKLTSYEPNKLVYKSHSATPGVAVFSEVYYPGWKATVDGKEVEIGRVNYILRALQLSGGDHEIVFTFIPKTITLTETVAYAAMAILLLGVLGYIFLGRKKEQE
ncbi:MAG: YfhO family protein [Bacteroidota bacterium]|nr:YfhO family protein [Bacteroidota bacterium]